MALEKIEPEWLDVDPTKRMPGDLDVKSLVKATIKPVDNTVRDRMVFVTAANKAGEYWVEGKLVILFLV
jgi:hypothetical protein